MGSKSARRELEGINLKIEGKTEDSAKGRNSSFVILTRSCTKNLSANLKLENSENQEGTKKTSKLKQASNKKEICEIECPICFDLLTSKEIRLTICGHVFCKDCIFLHFAKKNNRLINCPMCTKRLYKNTIRKFNL